MLIMRFKLKARINHRDDRTVRHALAQLAANGDVKKVGGEFVVYAEIEGSSAEELNKTMLSALKSVRKRTKLRAEWTSDGGITQTYFDDLLILENFKFFALQYLNDWYEKDRGFINELSSITKEIRLRNLHDAAQYYGVLRNFGGVAEKGLDAAFTLLENAAQTVTLQSQSVIAVVSQLAKDFEIAYPVKKKEKVSAASKFLWLRCQSPVVIRDTNAFACLQAASCGTLTESDYGAYWREWRRQFSKRKARIRSACAQLVGVKEFSLAKDISDQELALLVASRWFQERVFDKFLLWNGERILRN
jgi:hypothetical protein